MNNFRKTIILFLLIISGVKCVEDSYIGYEDNRGRGRRILTDNNRIQIRIVYLYQDPDETSFTYTKKKNKLSTVVGINTFSTIKEFPILKDIKVELYEIDNKLINFKKIVFYRDSVNNSEDGSFSFLNEQELISSNEKMVKDGNHVIEFVYPVLKNKKLILKYKINLMHGDKEYLFEDTVELHYTD